MLRYTTPILKFKKQGEKTGWSYIEVPARIAGKLKPGYKKSFRVKGKLDNFSIEMTAILPMGEGDFIMPINAAIRKATRKRGGDTLTVQFEVDTRPFILNPELIACLTDEPEALKFFSSLPGSHQRYFSKWIESAKTHATKAKRIAQTVNAMVKRQSFAEMMRALKASRI